MDPRRWTRAGIEICTRELFLSNWADVEDLLEALVHVFRGNQEYMNLNIKLNINVPNTVGAADPNGI